MIECVRTLVLTDADRMHSYQLLMYLTAHLSNAGPPSTHLHIDSLGE